MFLKLFDPIFNALNKNVKIALLAILITVLIFWGMSGEIRAKNKGDECAEERRTDRETIIALSAELRDMRTRMFDAFMMQQAQKQEVKQNDSVARHATEKALNKIQP